MMLLSCIINAAALLALQASSTVLAAVRLPGEPADRKVNLFLQLEGLARIKASGHGFSHRKPLLGV